MDQGSISVLKSPVLHAKHTHPSKGLDSQENRKPEKWQRFFYYDTVMDQRSSGDARNEVDATNRFHIFPGIVSSALSHMFFDRATKR